ncbi:hypothetical protein CFOL_v3_05442 [Cephalotus follicularis]|uniref:Uncharacterized protein n=1 Tax=Cephalotus follicularis TaxID=3775 RepID=A0A1Q3B1N0_CEPFO|nr:hypothetical protein CFOL_v3_05442 [Cephalotus follicularis]
METRLMAYEMEGIRIRLKFQNCLTVNCDGGKGGLAMLWDDSMLATVNSYSSNYIDLLIGGENQLGTWRLTGIYGHLEVRKRGETWNFKNRGFAWETLMKS